MQAFPADHVATGARVVSGDAQGLGSGVADGRNPVATVGAAG